MLLILLADDKMEIHLLLRPAFSYYFLIVHNLFLGRKKRTVGVTVKTSKKIDPDRYPQNLQLNKQTKVEYATSESIYPNMTYYKLCRPS